MPSFYVPNRYTTSRQIGAYLIGCADGLFGWVPRSEFLEHPIDHPFGSEVAQPYDEGFKKGRSLREVL